MLKIHVQPARDITEPTRSVTSRARVCESDSPTDMVKNSHLSSSKPKQEEDHAWYITGATCCKFDGKPKFIFKSRSKSERKRTKTEVVLPHNDIHGYHQERARKCR